MKNVLTLKGYENLTELDYTGEANDIKDVYSMSIISGIPNDKLKVMKPSSYAQYKHTLLSQISTKMPPVYLVKYKGTIYGYYPCELGTVEDMAAMELFSKGKKWQALAALLFRPVKKMSRWAHRKENRFQDVHDVKIKPIVDYKKDSLKYRVEEIDFARMDLSHWDDFPFQILLANMGFLVGSGVQFSLSIHPSSLKSPVIRKEIRILQQNLQEVMTGLIWQKVLPQLMFLNSTVNNVRLTSPQEKLASTTLSSSASQMISKLKAECSESAWVVTGDFNKGLLEGVLTTWENILNKDLGMNELMSIHGLMKGHKYNNRLSWLSLT